jgi:hypothetical protein
MIGAAMQAPIAALALVLELTHSGLELMVPILAAAAVAFYVDGYSIYSVRMAIGPTDGAAGLEPRPRAAVGPAGQPGDGAPPAATAGNARARCTGPALASRPDRTHHGRRVRCRSRQPSLYEQNGVLGSQIVTYPKLATLALVALLAVGCGSAGTSTPQLAPSSATSTSVPAPVTSTSAPAPVTSTSAPSFTTSTSAPRSSTAVPTPSTAASCYPLTNTGKCYAPGQYCRNSDRDKSGVAGNGEKIVCKNQNGWRWELA